MSEFVLIVCIMFAIVGFMWSSSGFTNAAIKTSFFGMVVWGGYLMFGPMNLITQFAK